MVLTVSSKLLKTIKKDGKTSKNLIYRRTVGVELVTVIDKLNGLSL